MHTTTIDLSSMEINKIITGARIYHVHPNILFVVKQIFISSKIRINYEKKNIMMSAHFSTTY